MLVCCRPSFKKKKKKPDKSSFRDAVNAELLTVKTSAHYLFSMERQRQRVGGKPVYTSELKNFFVMFYFRGSIMHLI